MTRLAMFSVAIAFALLKVSGINAAKDFDIENVYERSGQIRKKDVSVQRMPEYQSVERKENIGDEILQLIQSIARSPQFETRSANKLNNFIHNVKDRRDKYDRYGGNPWKPYLYVKPSWLKKNYTPRKRNRLSDLNRPADNNYDLDEYSKIFLVLDSSADITKSDAKDISNLVSSMLSKRNAREKTAQRDPLQRIKRYKGFAVRDHNRRRMRDSNEMYVAKDSNERDYKQKKKPRGEYGGGGGRTAIPYIRQRGDVFERE